MSRKRRSKKSQSGTTTTLRQSERRSRPAPTPVPVQPIGATSSVLNRKTLGLVYACGFVVQLCVYWRTLCPTIGGGDSPELVAAAFSGGAAHPPGYPLWLLLNRIVFWATGASSAPSASMSPAFVANAFNALLQSGAGTAVLAAATELSGSVTAGLVSLGLYAFADTTWAYAVVAEVFALNNLLIGLFVLLLGRFEAAMSRSSDGVRPSSPLQLALAGACVAGLLLSNQHTSVLTLGILIPGIVIRHHKYLLNSQSVAFTAIAFLAGVIPPYCYLACGCGGNSVFWASARNSTAFVAWGDAGGSLRGFLDHVLRREYGTFQLTSDGTTNDSPQRIWETGSFLITHSLDSCTWHIGFALCFIGQIASPVCGGQRGIKGLLTAALLFYFVFFSLRANIDVTKPLLAGVLERFTLQSDVIIAVLAAPGVAAVESRAMSCFAQKKTYSPIPGLLLATMFVAVEVARKFVFHDQTSNTAIEVYGRAILEGSMPTGSVLLLTGDLPGNAARYMQSCAGLRPDVLLLDLQMMNYEWYIPLVARPNLETATGAAIAATANLAQAGAKDEEIQRAKKASDGLASFVFPGKAYSPEPGGFMSGDLLRQNPLADFYAFTDMRDDDSSWTTTHELWNNGLVKRLVLREADALGGQVHRLIHQPKWLKNTLKLSLLPAKAFPLPPIEKYGPGTWEFICAITFRAAATELALFLENMAASFAGTGDSRSELAALRASAKVYEYQFKTFEERMEPTGEDFWFKNYGLVAHKLAGRLGISSAQEPQTAVALEKSGRSKLEELRAEQRHWNRVMVKSWSRYLQSDAGSRDSQASAIQEYVRIGQQSMEIG